MCASVLRLVTAWVLELGEGLFVACAFRDKGCLRLPSCYPVEMDYGTLLGGQILGEGRGSRAAGTCPDMPFAPSPVIWGSYEGGAARRVAPSPVLGHLTKIGILTTPLASWRKGRASYFSLLGLISERRSVIGARKFTTSLGGN